MGWQQCETVSSEVQGTQHHWVERGKDKDKDQPPAYETTAISMFWILGDPKRGQGIFALCISIWTMLCIITCIIHTMWV